MERKGNVAGSMRNISTGRSECECLLSPDSLEMGPSISPSLMLLQVGRSTYSFALGLENLSPAMSWIGAVLGHQGAFRARRP